jgi:cytochrome c oxidase subunit 2
MALARGEAQAQSMAYFQTSGPAADPITRLGWGLGIVALAVTAIVAVLLMLAIVRRRPLPADPCALTVRSDEGGLAWIYIGVGTSTLALIACAVWTLFTIAAVAMPARAGEMVVRVEAAQWWWDVRYEDSVPSQVFTAANEIHIPVGRPVRVELASNDVIHSFWIPQLAGKMDVIPGQTNVTWMQADHPGIYRGQCSEYCGVQHAHMAMVVVADSPDGYRAWRQAQLQPAAVPVSDIAMRGHATFLAHCAACHTVRGGDAGGILGPDLTHLMSRNTIAAGILPNTPGNLSAWIADAQALKPGSRMPSMNLAASELTDVVGYLHTLH